MDESKIRRMIRIEKLVRKDARGELKIARYYRSDYLGMMLLKNFFLVTVGYILFLGLYLVMHGDAILDDIYGANLRAMVVVWVGGYVFLLAFYTVVSYMICTLRFMRAKKLERYLDHQLQLLQGEDEQDDDSEEEHPGRGTI